MSSDPMVMLSCRVPPGMKSQLERIAANAEPQPDGRPVDRSEVQRRILADGIRRALAAARHPALLPDELRPVIDPGGPR